MTISQILYRIRGNAKIITLISILSVTTITAGGMEFGLYYNIGKDTQNMYQIRSYVMIMHQIYNVMQ